MNIDLKREPERFGVGTTLYGYEVIDLATGHPVGHRIYESAQSANGSAQRLNFALLAGPRALARALGATDDPLPRNYLGSR